MKENNKIKRDLEAAYKNIEEFTKLLDSATKKNVVLEEKLQTIKSAVEINQIPNANDQVVMMGDETEDTTCNQCDFIGKSVRELAGHVKFEHLRCKACNTCFASDKDIKVHNNKMHSIELHQCLPCTLIFPNKTGLEVHIKKKHNNYEKFECGLCHEMFSSQSDVRNHMKEKHSEGNSNKSQWECPMCDKLFASEEVLVKHIDNDHLEKDSDSDKRNRKECKNGLNCRFLKQNRCMFYHEVAAQEGAWQEVSHHRKGKETWAKGRHGGSYRVHPITVQWCKNGNSCHKGKRLPNGKMWNCAFRHNKSDFQENLVTGRK